MLPRQKPGRANPSCAPKKTLWSCLRLGRPAGGRPAGRPRRRESGAAPRPLGVVPLARRRVLAALSTGERPAEVYGARLTPAIERGQPPNRDTPVTTQTSAWSARHVGDLNREAYHLVICDEAHTA